MATEPTETFNIIRYFYHGDVNCDISQDLSFSWVPNNLTDNNIYTSAKINIYLQ